MKFHLCNYKISSPTCRVSTLYYPILVFRNVDGVVSNERDDVDGARPYRRRVHDVYGVIIVKKAHCLLKNVVLRHIDVPWPVIVTVINAQRNRSASYRRCCYPDNRISALADHKICSSTICVMDVRFDVANDVDSVTLVNRVVILMLQQTAV